MTLLYKKRGHKPFLIDNGFNWWAFFFCGLWALYTRVLWSPTILGVVIPISIDRAFKGGQNDHIAILLLFIMMLVYGFKGNDWLKQSLEEQGYTHDSIY